MKELVRRTSPRAAGRGPERCLRIERPGGCNDQGDLRHQHVPGRVRNCVQRQARRTPGRRRPTAPPMGVPPEVTYDVSHVASFEAVDGGRTKMTVTEYGYTTERARDVLWELARSENVTFEIAEILLGDDHDLIHKATGGWLREAGKKDLQRLLRFLDGYAATMLRYAIEHLDGEQRSHYLSLKQATEAGQDRGGDRS
jgi:hypothetical protein